MKNGDLCGFALPKKVAPFKVQIVPKIESEEKKDFANKLYQAMQQENIGAILDDRENISLGAKIKDCKILGTPYLIVIGDKQQGEQIELEDIKTGEKNTYNIKELIEELKRI